MTNPQHRLGIFGAGGHARVVADIAQKSDDYNLVAIFDDDEARRGETFVGVPISGGQHALFEAFKDDRIDYAFVAVGNNIFRQRLNTELRDANIPIATLVDSTATVSDNVSIASGTVVMPRVVINASALIGHDVILNTGCTIDHECFIGDASHIGPGTNLCGNVSVGIRTLIGVGSSVTPGVAIGSDAVIGAGSVIVSSLPNDVTAYGNPAKPIS